MNLTPDNIMDGIQQKNIDLTAKNEEYAKLSEEVAQARRAYRVLKAKTIIELKGKGHPVTLIRELTQGDESVAEARFKFDVSEGLYKACRESILDIRTAIDSYRSLLAWIKEEMHNAR